MSRSACKQTLNGGPVWLEECRLRILVAGDFDGEGKWDLAGLNVAGNISYTNDLMVCKAIGGVLSQFAQ